MGDKGGTRVVRTVCQECGNSCGMTVHVEDGRAVKVEPASDSRGASARFCARATAGLERLYSPYRLLYPQKRAGEKGGGAWQRISWDEALDTVAAKFEAAKKGHGAESVSLAKGIYCRQADYVSRLGNVFGTPNVTSIDNTCYVPSAAGRLLTYGFDGMPDVAGGPQCVLLWGNSPNPPLQPGAKLIVINVLETAAAKRADLWLRPRPGSDLALALAMLNVIVGEGLYDRAFVADWTTGFDALAHHVADYSPESHGRAHLGARGADRARRRACSRAAGPGACGTATPTTHLQQHAVRAGLRDHAGHLRQPRCARRHLRGEGHDPLRGDGSRHPPASAAVPSRRRRSWGPTQAIFPRPGSGTRSSANRSKCGRITCSRPSSRRSPTP